MVKARFTTVLTLVNIFTVWSLPTGEDSDPCSGTVCGKGAECRLVSSLIVCICDDNSVGDPFVECKPMLNPSDLISESTTITTIPQTLTSTSSSELTLGTSHPPKTTVGNSENNMNKENFPLDSSSQPTMTENTYANPNANFGDTFFPSAPPTLSHYAHLQNFQQNINSNPSHFNIPTIPPLSMIAVERSSEMPAYHQHLNQLYGNTNRNRNRPPQQYNNGVITTELNDEPNYYDHKTKISLNDEYDSQSQHPMYRDNENNRKSPNSNQYVSPPGYPNHQTHHQNAFSSSNNHNHNNNMLPFVPQHQPHPTNTNFNSPSTSHPQEMMHEKIIDPLGKYDNCRTINNIVVCADTSETDTSHRGQSTSILEHRHFQVGQTTNHHNTPSYDKPVYPNYNNGPQGAINFNENNNPGLQTPIAGQGFPIPSSPSADERHQILQTIRPHEPNFLQNKLSTFPARPVISSPMPQPASNNKNDYQLQYQKTQPAQNHPTSEMNLCKQLCGEGSICRIINNRPVCGCPQGFTGDPGVRCFPDTSNNLNTKFDPNSCSRHTDCPTTMVCLKSQCTDPCLIKSTVNKSNISSFHYSLDSSPDSNSMCGTNARCTTIEHTPICSCETNYYGNPYVGCVP